MRKLFVPLLVVTAAMFAYAPVRDLRARRTSPRWGWCRRSSTSTCRRGSRCSLRPCVCGIASALCLFTGRQGADRVAVAAAELAVAVRADRAHHRSVVGAEGVGRVVAVGRAADVGARDVADLRRLPAAAAVRRRRIGEAVGRGRALRHGQRAVRLLVGQRLANRPPEDHRSS